MLLIILEIWFQYFVFFYMTAVGWNYSRTPYYYFGYLDIRGKMIKTLWLNSGEKENNVSFYLTSEDDYVVLETSIEAFNTLRLRDKTLSIHCYIKGSE